MGVIEVNENILKDVYQKRNEWSHKGDYGRLLVIGGSKYYTGAPFLVAMAAMRAGVDIVTIAAPQKVASIIASFSPNIIVRGFGDSTFSIKNVNSIAKLSRQFDAIVIGNGIGMGSETKGFVKEFLKINKRPCVIDGDALKFLDIEEIRLNAKYMLMPHANEFYELCKEKVKNNVSDRIGKVKKIAKIINAIIVLKGHVDVISDGKRVAINKTGNAFMTKAGTGDVLAGIAGSMLARGIDTFNAACASCHLCGKAGDKAAKKLKDSLLATDVIDNIPSVLSEAMNPRY